MLKSIKPGEWAVGGFVLLYLVAFSAWFFSIGNTEFIIYIATMVVLVALVGSTLRLAEYPIPSGRWQSGGFSIVPAAVCRWAIRCSTPPNSCRSSAMATA